MANFIGLCLISLFSLASQVHCEYFVDPLNDLVEFEGWGTSLAWWPDVLGKMPEDVIDHITKAFFSPDGLNLNIVRYTIGGTTPGNYTCGPFRAGGATESFRDGPNQPYNWTRDAGQRRILAIAKELGADTFEAFSNSPPQWMTKTGCSKGNSQGDKLHSNFDISQASSFAQYAADVLEHFKTDWGITFQTYAPFNEPYGILGDGFWTGEEKEQEGCNIDHETMTEIIKLMYFLFRERNISTQLSVADETQVDTAVISQEYFHDAGISPLINKVNGHGYWDSNEVRRDVLHRNSVRDGHRLWMDEVGWGQSPLHDMSQGLNLATRILMDINVMVSSAWVYWQVMEDVGAWGLLAVPYNNASVGNIQYNNGYSAFLQFTRYIRKGFSIINTNNANTLAAYDARSQTLVLVVVNPTKENEQHEFNLDLFFGALNEIFATRTSSSEQHQNVSPEVALRNKILSYTSPAESITTIVLKDVTVGSTQSNLVQDGDFELQPSKWLLEAYADVTNFNHWSGSKSGEIRGQGSIRQVISAEKTGKFFVSAWCSSTSNSNNGAKLSAFVNNVEVTEVAVYGHVYRSYGLVLPVQAGDNVTISFEGNNGESYIDNVVVHVNA